MTMFNYQSLTDNISMYVSFSIKNLATYVRPALLARKHVLSEKPAVGENVKDSVALIKWYRSAIAGPTCSIAEK